MVQKVFTFELAGELGLGKYGVVIVFPKGAVSSDDIHNRAFSLAITAHITGKKVRIAALKTDNQNCRHAGFIVLTD